MQSRSRAVNRPAPQVPERIPVSLPKTAGYLPLVAVLGIAGIIFGILLRILALRMEQR
jgi:hypothetical protein